MKGKDTPHPFLEGMAFMGLLAVGIIVYFFFAPVFPKSSAEKEGYMTSESMMYAEDGEYYDSEADMVDTVSNDAYPAQ